MRFYIVGIVVSLVAPEKLAQQKFAEVEQQIHLVPVVIEPIASTVK